MLNELREINVYASAEIEANPASHGEPAWKPRRAKQCCSPASGIVGWACGWWSLWTSARRFFNSDRTEGVFVHNSERVTPAKWCAFSSQVNGKPVTIAIFDCPKNHPRRDFSPCGRSPYMAQRSTCGRSRSTYIEPTAGLSYGVAVWTETSPPTTLRRRIINGSRRKRPQEPLLFSSPTPLRADG